MLEEWLIFKEKVETQKASLAGADLSTAKLMRASLSGANLAGADLSSTYLIRADLSGADLSDADLEDAILSEANLTGADLNGANLEDAYLNGADLTGVKNLTCDQVLLAIIDRETRLPDYIRLVWTSDSTYECEDGNC